MRKEEERKARLERELREKERQVETLVLLVVETGVIFQFYNSTCIKVRERQEREKRERRQREERARREGQERRRRAEKAKRREE